MTASISIFNVREVKVIDRYYKNIEKPLVTRQLMITDKNGVSHEVTLYGEVYDDITFDTAKVEFAE